MFGNVNVDYKPCKSVTQLRRACNYILGRNPEQISSGVVKTRSDLYYAFDDDRDNFADAVLLTRRLWDKTCNKSSNLAYKMSISFHSAENLTYEVAFQIAKEFAKKFFHSKGFDVMFAVHTEIISTQILLSATVTVIQVKLFAETKRTCMKCLSFSVSNAPKEDLHARCVRTITARIPGG